LPENGDHKYPFRSLRSLGLFLLTRDDSEGQQYLRQAYEILADLGAKDEQSERD